MQSITDRRNTNPARDRPRVSITKPALTELLINRMKSRCKRSNTDRADSNRETLCKSGNGPKQVLSNTKGMNSDLEDCNSNMGKSGHPMVLSKRREPRCRKSRVNMVESKRLEDRASDDRPKWLKSSANKGESKCARLWGNRNNSRCIASNAETEPFNFAKPKEEAADSM